MPYIRELLEGLGVKYYELPNYEADDIIGTLANKVDKMNLMLSCYQGTEI